MKSRRLFVLALTLAAMLPSRAPADDCPGGFRAAVPPGSNILAVFTARDGATYLGTDRGLARALVGGGFCVWDVYHGLVSDLVFDVGEDAEGRVLIATDAGLAIFSDGRLRNYPAGPEFIGPGVASFGTGAVRELNGLSRPIPFAAALPEGAAKPAVVAMTTDYGWLLLYPDRMSYEPPPFFCRGWSCEKGDPRPPEPEPPAVDAAWGKALGPGRAAFYPRNWVTEWEDIIATGMGEPFGVPGATATPAALGPAVSARPYAYPCRHPPDPLVLAGLAGLFLSLTIIFVAFARRLS